MEVFGLSIKLKEEGAAAVESSMKKLNVAAAAVGATIGVVLVAALRKTVTASIEAQAVQAQLAAAIRSTGGVAGQSVTALNEHAAALQKVTSFGDEAINKAQSLLLTFTKIQGDTFPKATEAVLNVATAMGTDLQSAAIQVGKALNDPILGVTALARSGIQFTQSQKDTIKALVETGQQAEAQRLILKELEVQFGGSAKAARDTLGGALAGLRNAFGDLFEVSQDGTKGVVNVLNLLEDAIRRVQERMALAVSAAKALAVALTAPFIARAVASLVGYIGTVRTMIAAQRVTIALAAQEATAAAANVRALVAKGAATRAVEVAQLRAAIASRNLTLQTSLLSRAMLTATGVARGLWAAIGGPIGAIVIGIAALSMAFDAWLSKQQRAIDAQDKASAKNPAYLAALEKLRARRAALTKAEEDAAAAAAKVAEETANRTANLVKLTALTTVTRNEYKELLTAERDIAAQLRAGNIPLSERVALLEKQRDVLAALASSSVTGERERMEAIGAAPSTERITAKLDARGITDLPQRIQRDITQGITAKVARDTQAAADQLAVTIEDTFAAAIATSIVAGIAGGIENAIASGSIAAGFTALGATMLAGLGDAAIRFGIETMKLGEIMQGIVSSFSSLLPGGAIAKGAMMIAFGAALKGAAGAAFGGGRPVGRTSTNPLGALGGGMGMGDGTVTRLLFGQTSASTAAGMTPRTATNVTIIGPDDPKAQRAIQELINKGNTRGNLG
jgi:hypothetical protein